MSKMTGKEALQIILENSAPPYTPKQVSDNDSCQLYNDAYVTAVATIGKVIDRLEAKEHTNDEND